MIRNNAPVMLLLLLVTGAVAVHAEPAPAVPPQVMPAPDPSRMVPPYLSETEALQFRQQMTAYLQCRQDKADAVNLSEMAENLIWARDHRAVWEELLASNHSLQLQYPQGYPQMIEAGFNEYRRLGGTATTITEVQRIEKPCINPWDTLQHHGEPLKASRQLPIR